MAGTVSERYGEWENLVTVILKTVHVRARQPMLMNPYSCPNAELKRWETVVGGLLEILKISLNKAVIKKPTTFPVSIQQCSAMQTILGGALRRLTSTKRLAGVHLGHQTANMGYPLFRDGGKWPSHHRIRVD